MLAEYKPIIVGDDKPCQAANCHTCITVLSNNVQPMEWEKIRLAGLGRLHIAGFACSVKPLHIAGFAVSVRLSSHCWVCQQC